MTITARAAEGKLHGSVGRVAADARAVGHEIAIAEVKMPLGAIREVGEFSGRSAPLDVTTTVGLVIAE